VSVVVEAVCVICLPERGHPVNSSANTGSNNNAFFIGVKVAEKSNAIEHEYSKIKHVCFIFYFGCGEENAGRVVILFLQQHANDAAE
jgi:hypothetical protein